MRPLVKKHSFFIFIILFLCVIGVSYGAYQVLSISQASLSVDGQVGQSWLVTLINIPSYERVTGTVTQSDVKDKSGQTPSTDFNIDINSNTQLYYRIVDTGKQLYTYQVDHSTKCTQLVCGNPCTNHPDAVGAYSATVRTNLLTLECTDYYIKRVPVGKEGDIESSPSVRSLVTFNVNAGGKTAGTSQIDTFSNQEGVLPNNWGRVQWVGDLVTPYSTPDISISLKPLYVGDWFLINNQQAAANYFSYRNSDDSRVVSCLVAYLGSYGNKVISESDINAAFTSCVNEPNNLYTTMIRDTNLYNNFNGATLPAFGRIQTGITKTVGQSPIFNGDFVVLNPTSAQFRYSEFNLILSTNMVGIEIQKTKPKINSIIGYDCYAGTSGKVVMTVQNQGNDGTIVGKLICGAGSIQPNNPEQRQTFQAGETKDFTFDFGSTSAAQQTCTVSVEDSYEMVETTADVALQCHGASLCGDGVCASGETVQSCPKDCISTCGNKVCDAGENWRNCPSDCGQNLQKWWETYWWAILIGVVVIGGIIYYIVWRKSR